MRTAITVNYLEMRPPTDAPPAPARSGLHTCEARRPSPQLSRYLYTAVGSPWTWYMRRSWSYDRWMTHLRQPGLSTHIGYVAGTPAGYFELQKHPDASTEIKLFGLLPEFIGEGLGSILLSDCVDAAWKTGAARVWLHTCSLDHPAALPNYQARGFTLFRTDRFVDNLPDQPLQPFENAGRPYSSPAGP